MALLEGVVRQLQRLSRGQQAVSLDDFGNMLVSQMLPKYAALSAAGRLFAVDMTAGTAKAPVTAAPTTSPEWGIYNASPNETLALIEVSCAMASGTSGLGLAIMVATAIGPQTVVSADYSGAVKNCLNGSPATPAFYLTNNPTLIGGTPAWHYAASQMGQVAQTQVGGGLVAHVNGVFTAKPGGHMVGIELVGAAGTTDLYDVSAIVAMLPSNFN